jgi:serine/threonine protein kinase/tetratricopeptide (TPR) repeat protein
MALTPGQKLAHYEVLGTLGAGGMGEVFRARDTRLGRDVAVKVLPDAVASHPERLARFEREARTVAALNHPNIVVLHSIEEDRGIHFLTMELVEGQTLDALIAPGGLPLSRVLEIAIPLADALTAAHERNVVHRDLKPKNVMLTRDGRVKVLDFGLAKLASGVESNPSDSASPTVPAISAVGEVVGTVPYMAPEQIRGEAVDVRTDLFAFGIMVYELATGRRPFTGPTLADVSSAILRDTPARITSLRTDLPGELARIVERCLEKDARARFQRARDVIQELRLLQQAPGQEGSTTGPDVIRSLAVLPLDNVSRDPAQEYFADGMTEALISDLARLRHLRVISRTSAMKYKGVHRALPEIARELNVDAIIEGSALLVGKRVRISVQLVSARRDEMLWSERYDRDLEDVLALQSDVAEAVAKEIAIRVTPVEAKRLAHREEVNPEAHLEYLKGKHTAAATSPQAIELSLRYFQRALELDPTYAPAWAGVADCHYTRAARGMAPPAEACAQARAAAMKALELDDSLADAYSVLGGVQAVERDLPGAVRSLQKAIDLNPGLAPAYHVLGRIYYCTERHAEAQEAMLKTVSLDPLSMILHTAVGDACYYAREYEKSVGYYRKAIRLDPRFDGAHTDLARSLEALGRFDEARAEYEEGRRLAGTVAGPSFGLAHLEVSLGNADTARRMLAELTAARSEHVVSAWGIAAVHASLGDIDEAFRWLETAMVEGATGLIYLRVHPRLDPIRQDPRFAELVRRYGLDRV